MLVELVQHQEVDVVGDRNEMRAEQRTPLAADGDRSRDHLERAAVVNRAGVDEHGVATGRDRAHARSAIVEHDIFGPEVGDAFPIGRRCELVDSPHRLESQVVECRRFALAAERRQRVVERIRREELHRGDAVVVAAPLQHMEGQLDRTARDFVPGTGDRVHDRSFGHGVNRVDRHAHVGDDLAPGLGQVDLHSTSASVPWPTSR